jgi:hypothetical protein
MLYLHSNYSDNLINLLTLSVRFIFVPFSIRDFTCDSSPFHATFTNGDPFLGIWERTLTTSKWPFFEAF